MASLKEYKKKRNFKKTSEPKGKVKKQKNNLFVVQLHDASRLHYDFRLEVDGVLKSWAVPKGPPNEGEKRLAVNVEDHPLSYARFEGTIPEGNYGAGTVMVWDIGTYENINYDKGKQMTMKGAIKRGDVKIVLNGKKLKGEYVLVKFKDETDNWLFIKKKGQQKLRVATKSVLSGRTLRQIENE